MSRELSRFTMPLLFITFRQIAHTKQLRSLCSHSLKALLITCHLQQGQMQSTQITKQQPNDLTGLHHIIGLYGYDYSICWELPGGYSKQALQMQCDKGLI